MYLNVKPVITSNVITRVTIECVRRSHFKFGDTQHTQQSAVLDRLLKRNDNIVKKLMDNRTSILSKGVPNRRESDRTVGHIDTKVITRRMTVLNKLLMECITDVLSTEVIGEELSELEVHITHVRVNRPCDSVNIYWITKKDDITTVADKLDQIKGRLRQHIMDRHYMHYVPWVQFVMDVSESHSLEVDRILKTCDFGADFEPFDTTLFETPYEKATKSKDMSKREMKRMDNKNDNQSDIYESLKMKRPDDMKMDCFGLNYEILMNIVLQNLSKSRAQHRSFNAVADPLPPPDWTSNIAVNTPTDETNAVYNTDERIKIMKQFLVENRKKRERLSRHLRRQIILNEMDVKYRISDMYDNYVEQNMSEIQEDLNQNLDNNYDFEEQTND